MKLEPKDYGKSGPLKGTVVSPSAPREDDGSYWGYATRLASSINDVFDGCPYEGGYDLKIGTSERGSRSVEDKNFSIPKSHHFLIVFGGVAGIEECVDADESLKLQGSQSKKLFDLWYVVQIVWDWFLPAFSEPRLLSGSNHFFFLEIFEG